MHLVTQAWDSDPALSKGPATRHLSNELWHVSQAARYATVLDSEFASHAQVGIINYALQ
jgi:hypothetical protein